MLVFKDPVYYSFRALREVLSVAAFFIESYLQ